MSKAEIQKEIQDKGLNAPRLTPGIINSKIKDVAYHVFEDTCLTVCCMTLFNGFTVTGESACASPENFDAEIGQKIAFEQAENKIWMLEGYLLKQKLFQTPDTFGDRLMAEQSELREKLDKLASFIGSPTYINLPAVDRDLLNNQSGHMLAYLGVLEHRLSLLE